MNDEFEKKMKEIIEGVDPATRSDNPFVLSEKFAKLIHLMVTFVKNVSDPLWEELMKAAKEQDEGNPSYEMMKHLDALRKLLRQKLRGNQNSPGVAEVQCSVSNKTTITNNENTTHAMESQ